MYMYIQNIRKLFKLFFVYGLREIVWNWLFWIKMWSFTTTVFKIFNYFFNSLIQRQNNTIQYILILFKTIVIRMLWKIVVNWANRFSVISWIKWSSYLHEYIFSVYFMKHHHNMQTKKNLSYAYYYLFDIEDEEKRLKIKRGSFMTG